MSPPTAHAPSTTFNHLTGILDQLEILLRASDPALGGGGGSGGGAGRGAPASSPPHRRTGGPQEIPSLGRGGSFTPAAAAVHTSPAASFGPDFADCCRFLIDLAKGLPLQLRPPTLSSSEVGHAATMEEGENEGGGSRAKEEEEAAPAEAAKKAAAKARQVWTDYGWLE